MSAAEGRGLPGALLNGEDSEGSDEALRSNTGFRGSEGEGGLHSRTVSDGLRRFPDNCRVRRESGDSRLCALIQLSSDPLAFNACKLESENDVRCEHRSRSVSAAELTPPSLARKASFTLVRKTYDTQTVAMFHVRRVANKQRPRRHTAQLRSAALPECGSKTFSLDLVKLSRPTYLAPANIGVNLSSLGAKPL
ncbi:unnamed protein product [Spodoptera exigua]|nr:unnamed protein product [Spodoptera exigua]